MFRMSATVLLNLHITHPFLISLPISTFLITQGTKRAKNSIFLKWAGTQQILQNHLSALQRFRSAWTSMSLTSLCWPPEKDCDPWQPIEHPAKTDHTVAEQVDLSLQWMHTILYDLLCFSSNEPPDAKTCLRGLWHGKTQTGLLWQLQRPVTVLKFWV